MVRINIYPYMDPHPVKINLPAQIEEQVPIQVCKTIDKQRTPIVIGKGRSVHSPWLRTNFCLLKKKEFLLFKKKTILSFLQESRTSSIFYNML